MPRLPRPCEARLRSTADRPATIAIAGTTSGRVHRTDSRDRGRAGRSCAATTAATLVSAGGTAAMAEAVRLRVSGAMILPEAASPLSPEVVKLASGRENE